MTIQNQRQPFNKLQQLLLAIGEDIRDLDKFWFWRFYQWNTLLFALYQKVLLWFQNILKILQNLFHHLRIFCKIFLITYSYHLSPVLRFHRLYNTLTYPETFFSNSLPIILTHLNFKLSLEEVSWVETSFTRVND